MAIMTSEAEDELGGYRLHTTLAGGAASGIFQREGTARRNPPAAAGNCVLVLASGEAVPRGRLMQENLEGILLGKASGRGCCQKMLSEASFKAKPGKGFSMGMLQPLHTRCNTSTYWASGCKPLLATPTPTDRVPLVLCCVPSHPWCFLATSEPSGFHFSSSGRAQQSLHQPGCVGWAVEDGEACSGAMRTSRCFWPGGSGGERCCLRAEALSGAEEVQLSPPPSLLSASLECAASRSSGQSWGQRHPKIKSFRTSQICCTFADPVSGAIPLPPPKSRPRSPGSFWIMVINSYCSLKPDHKFHSVIM